MFVTHIAYTILRWPFLEQRNSRGLVVDLIYQNTRRTEEEEEEEEEARYENFATLENQDIIGSIFSY